MGKPYSMELRERVIAACDQGHGSTQVARRFDVSASWVRRLKQHRRERGTLAPLPSNAGRKPKLDDRDLQQIAQRIKQDPGVTLRELQQHLTVRVCLQTISNVLERMNLTLKKSRCAPPNRNATM